MTKKPPAASYLWYHAYGTMLTVHKLLLSEHLDCVSPYFGGRGSSDRSSSDGSSNDRTLSLSLELFESLHRSPVDVINWSNSIWQTAFTMRSSRRIRWAVSSRRFVSVRKLLKIFRESVE